MRKLILALAAAVMLVPAHASQNNLFLEVQKNQISYQGRNVQLEDVQAMLSGDICYSNVVVFSDFATQAYTLFAIREIVEKNAGPQLLFVSRFTDKNPGLGSLRVPPCIYFGNSFAYEPMTRGEFLNEEYVEGVAPSVILDGKKLYMESAATNLVEVVDRLKEKFGQSEEYISLRVKVTMDTSFGELLEFDRYFVNEAAVNGLKVSNTYFTQPDAAIAPIAIDMIWADFAEIEVPTYDIADELGSVPTFMGQEDILAFGKYVESIYEYDIEKYRGAQGRVWVDFTICADGTIRDVVAVHGIEEVRECAVEAVKKAPALWVPARDANGNPVNVRVHKLMIKILAHL